MAKRSVSPPKKIGAPSDAQMWQLWWDMNMQSKQKSFEERRASSATATAEAGEELPITAFFNNRATGAKHELVYSGCERDTVARALSDIREALEAGYDVSIIRLWPGDI